MCYRINHFDSYLRLTTLCLRDHCSGSWSNYDVKAPPSVHSRNITQQFQCFRLEYARKCSCERQIRLGTLVRACAIDDRREPKNFGARAFKQH